MRTFANAQTRQGIGCLHALSMYRDKDLRQIYTSNQRRRLKEDSAGMQY